MSYKQAIVVRKDLQLGKGKIAAQVAHASLGSVRKADKKIVAEWEEGGAKKVVLKVDNLEKLKELQKIAESEKLPVFVVRDAGLTQIKEGTVTCIGIGPAEEEKVDKVTKNLKLF